MAKIKISSTELVWIFHQRLEAFDDCPSEVTIAIVPDPDEGWMAVMSAQSRTHNPLCARRVEAIQKQLREIYVLRDLAGAGEPRLALPGDRPRLGRVVAPATALTVSIVSHELSRRARKVVGRRIQL
jgi:hypothetical protein